MEKKESFVNKRGIESNNHNTYFCSPLLTSKSVKETSRSTVFQYLPFSNMV